MDRQIELMSLVSGQIAACTSCVLCETRKNTVPGRGSPTPKILFVGEGPGEQEDIQGLPFVGRAGELLEEGIRRAALEPSDYFITNVVKCRPPGNRNPTLPEMEACAGFLRAQQEVLKPELIVVLGKVAAEYLLGRPVKITRENGAIDFLKDGTMVLIVLHPAYVLRNQVPEVRESFFEAIHEAKALVETV